MPLLIRGFIRSFFATGHFTLPQVADFHPWVKEHFEICGGGTATASRFGLDRGPEFRYDCQIDLKPCRAF